MTLEEFCRENARLFSLGDVAGSASCVDVPLTAKIAGSNFAANSIDDVVVALTVFRQNLLVESFQSLDVIEFYGTDPIDGRSQAFLRYRITNDTGGAIDTFDATFICRQTEDGGWAVCEAESLPPAKDRFLQGIPLT